MVALRVTARFAYAVAEARRAQHVRRRWLPVRPAQGCV